jgi:hypothetical protein
VSKRRTAQKCHIIREAVERLECRKAALYARLGDVAVFANKDGVAIGTPEAVLEWISEWGAGNAAGLANRMAQCPAGALPLLVGVRGPGYTDVFVEWLYVDKDEAAS